MPMLSIDPQLQDIIDAQPGNRRRFLRQNWLALAMFVAWIVTQIVTSGNWLAARTDKEVSLSEQVHDLQINSVRKDVFDQVLRRIDERLASIDAKSDRK
jgi:hypothetical protein